MKIGRYIRGLNSSIGNKVELIPYTFFDDVTKMATRIEKQEKEKIQSPFTKISLRCQSRGGGFGTYKSTSYNGNTAYSKGREAKRKDPGEFRTSCTSKEKVFQMSRLRTLCKGTA